VGGLIWWGGLLPGTGEGLFRLRWGAAASGSGVFRVDLNGDTVDGLFVFECARDEGFALSLELGNEGVARELGTGQQPDFSEPSFDRVREGEWLGRL